MDNRIAYSYAQQIIINNKTEKKQRKKTEKEKEKSKKWNDTEKRTTTNPTRAREAN